VAYVAVAEVRVSPGAEPRVVDYPPGATFGPRTLRDYELVWLLRGGAVWSWAGQTERLVPGSLLLCRPGMTDEFRWDGALPTRHAYVHFGLDSAPCGEAEWPLVRHLAPGDVLSGLLRYLLWLASAEPPRWADRVGEVLALLVATFVSGPVPGGDEAAPVPAPILAVVDFLRKRWADGPTVAVPTAQLAAAAAVSPSQLSRLFRTRFGLGPAGAVELLRLSRAEDLLLRSNLPIAAIAAHSGFADAYHFSRRFRAGYGVPPRRFRAEGPRAASPVEQVGLLPLQRRLWRLDEGAPAVSRDPR
jgi:AraC family transcriptional regulator